MRSVFLFFLCLLVLTASGRLGSKDAGAQLQATMLLATKGSLGMRGFPPGWDSALWIKGHDGLYYEAHDVGNIALMFPAALIGRMISRGSSVDIALTPPLITRVLISLTYAALSAVACLAMFRMFLIALPKREALLLSCVFVMTTFFWAYTKVAWDVLGACCFVCLLLCSSALMLTGRSTRMYLISSCASLGFAASFRYSLLPFLALSLALAVRAIRHRLSWNDIVLGGLTLALVISPDLLYNQIRMGSILRPATTASEFSTVNNLNGNIGQGLWGLLLSPNKGLFAFSPSLILILALPFVWRHLPQVFRQLLAAFGPGAILYLATISKLSEWGSFGWGPRYLLPILPILFLATSPVIWLLWTGRHRFILATLLLTSAAVAFPPVLVNWPLVIANSPRDLDPTASMPYQQIDTGMAFIHGMTGHPLVESIQAGNDPIRSLANEFPDMWTFYLARASKKTFVLGLILTTILAVGALQSFRRAFSIR